MDSLSKLQSIIMEVFKDQDEWLAGIFKDALDHHQPESGIVSALAWASGNIGNSLGKTGEVLFDFIEKFENQTLQDQVARLQNDLLDERNHSQFLEKLLEAVVGKNWDQLTFSEAKKLKVQHPDEGA